MPRKYRYKADEIAANMRRIEVLSLDTICDEGSPDDLMTAICALAGALDGAQPKHKRVWGRNDVLCIDLDRSRRPLS